MHLTFTSSGMTVFKVTGDQKGTEFSTDPPPGIERFISASAYRAAVSEVNAVYARHTSKFEWRRKAKAERRKFMSSVAARRAENLEPVVRARTILVRPFRTRYLSTWTHPAIR